MTNRFLSLIALVALWSLPLLATAQISIGEVLDFEDGNLGGFVIGNPTAGAAVGFSPAIVADGVGNNALQFSTNGAVGGPAHALLAFSNDFVSDFSPASALQFTASNPNASDLSVRISISSGGSATNATNPTGAFTSDVFLLEAGASELVTFAFDQSNFTALAGSTDSFADTLAAVQQLRIFHNPDLVTSPFGLAGALAIGDPAAPDAGTILIDNLTLVSSVPEPTSLAVLWGGLVFLGVRRRRVV